MPKLLFARPPLDAVEERKIRKLAGARHAPADWIHRAQMIALSWDGLRVPAIAAALGCSQKAVRYRLARFTADGLDGLGNRPASDAIPRISQAQRSQLIALVASPPPGRLVRDGAGELVTSDATGPAVWILDALTAAARAAGIDIARSQVRRILLAEGVRWRRPRSWATSADPEFVPKNPGRGLLQLAERQPAPPAQARVPPVADPLGPAAPPAPLAGRRGWCGCRGSGGVDDQADPGRGQLGGEAARSSGPWPAVSSGRRASSATALRSGRRGALRGC